MEIIPTSKIINRDGIKAIKNGQKLNKEEVHVVDSKLVIGILYEAKKCQKTDIKQIESNEITGKFCAFKNDIPLEEMNIGMGDIFIKMAR